MKISRSPLIAASCFFVEKLFHAVTTEIQQLHGEDPKKETCPNTPEYVCCSTLLIAFYPVFIAAETLIDTIRNKTKEADSPALFA